MNKDTDVNSSSEVIDVRNEDIFFAIIQQLLQHTGVVETLVYITVTRWVPAAPQIAHNIQQVAKKYCIIMTDRSINRSIN